MNLDGFEVRRRDGGSLTESKELLKRRLGFLYEIFNACTAGNGLDDEALEAGKLLVHFLNDHVIQAKPGLVFPDWNGALVKFFAQKGLIEKTMKAAELRGNPITDEELYFIKKALIEKKKFRQECFKLAEIYSQEGMIEQAAAAAKLAHKDLGEANLILIQHYMLRK